MTLRERWERVPARPFNRICLALALVWLEVSVPLGILHRPTVPDFGQFYMGGLIARRGEWKSLYPVPMPRSLDNAGLNGHSLAKPKWVLLSLARRVPDYTHFILPPPAALLFVPLSYLSYRQAFWVWTFIQIACLWGMAWVSGQLLRRIIGRTTRLEGVLAALIVLSPMCARAIRIANVSTPIALLIGVTLFSLIRRGRPESGAAAVVLGATLKYATLVLAPLFVAMRRWRMLLWAACLGVTLLLVTVAVAGTAPFVEFQKMILPTLSRPSAYAGNQSLPGLLARVCGRPLPWRILAGLNSVRFVTLALILARLAFVRPRQWRDPVRVLAAAGLLISWVLVFSPIAWEHWPVFLCPFWGWLLWEARDPGPRRWVAAASLALMYFPAGLGRVSGFAIFPYVLREPWNSFQLVGVALFLGLSFWRLGQGGSLRAIRLPPKREPEPVVIRAEAQRAQGA